MLEYLEFEIGGFHQGYLKLKLANIEDQLFYKYCAPFSFKELKDTPYILALVSNNWLVELENIHINRWKSNYIESDILDGTCWKLDYKEFDKRCRHINGDNEYPRNWINFITLLVEAIPNTNLVDFIY